MTQQAVGGTAPVQSPLGGIVPGLKVAALLKRLGDNLGYQQTNARFAASALTWIQDTLLEIQLADPLLRRVLVMDAPFTVVQGQGDYDVRQAPFNWTNCYAVLSLKFSEFDDRPLEPVTPEQYRARGVLAADQGLPGFFVKVDQFRIRIVPDPDQAYVGVGDYQQDLPSVANPDDRVDWPRAWDIVLLEGAMFRGYRWRSEQDGTWVKQRAVFRDLLGSMRTTEAVATRAPGKVVLTRMRHRVVVPHDNSADVRWRR